MTECPRTCDAWTVGVARNACEHHRSITFVLGGTVTRRLWVGEFTCSARSTIAIPTTATTASLRARAPTTSLPGDTDRCQQPTNRLWAESLLGGAQLSPAAVPSYQEPSIINGSIRPPTTSAHDAREPWTWRSGTTPDYE